MIEEQMVKLRKQIAENGQWLYQDQPQGNRVFSKEIYLGSESNLWHECTDAEKTAWEEAHQPTPPEDPADDRIEDTETVDDAY